MAKRTVDELIISRVYQLLDQSINNLFNYQGSDFLKKGERNVRLSSEKTGNK